MRLFSELKPPECRGKRKSVRVSAPISGALSAALLLLTCGCGTQDVENSVTAKTVASRFGFTTEAGEPKDFVINSRPAQPADFVPIGPYPKDRALARRKPDEVQKMQAGLDNDRDRTARFAKRPVPKSSYGDVNDAMKSLAAARARANRPVGAPVEQPQSYPVPPARRRNANPLALPKDQ
jgi:hypothetical protein